jgi:very-short-patch-repair endonuclease
MICAFCKYSKHSTAIKYNSMQDFDSTIVNTSMVRCSKCRKIFSCKNNNCMIKMKKHLEECKEKEQSIGYFCVGNCAPIGYSWVNIPKELGGGVADVKSITQYIDGELIIFYDFKYVLINDNGKYFWAKYKSEMDEYQKKQSIGEKICQKIIEEIYPNNKFQKIRPNWLKNTDTNKNMELDIYCNELKIAIEYNGKQHYEYIEYFHRNENNFNKQCERDKLKNELCIKNGIKLITIPYTLNSYDKIRECILQNLNL